MQYRSIHPVVNIPPSASTLNLTLKVPAHGLFARDNRTCGAQEITRPWPLSSGKSMEPFPRYSSHFLESTFIFPSSISIQAWNTVPSGSPEFRIFAVTLAFTNPAFAEPDTLNHSSWYWTGESADAAPTVAIIRTNASPNIVLLIVLSFTGPSDPCEYEQPHRA